MKRVIFNQKGGVGKSTISVNLAAQSARGGVKTLLVDLDTQGNSTHYCGFDANDDTLTVADMFKQIAGWFSSPRPARDFVHATPFENLFVLPSDHLLGTLERELESRYKMYKLKENLAELSSEFDAIYIDTPPNFSFYSKAALIAADAFIIPFDCDDFSARAIDHLLENVLELKEDHNKNLKFEGIVINQFNAQARLPTALVNALKKRELPVFDTHLSSSVKVKESHSVRKPLPFFAPSHKVTQQFAALHQELNNK